MSDGITDSRKMMRARQERLNELIYKLRLALEELEAEVGPSNWLEIAFDVLHDVKWRKG